MSRKHGKYRSYSEVGGMRKIEDILEFRRLSDKSQYETQFISLAKRTNHRDIDSQRRKRRSHNIDLLKQEISEKEENWSYSSYQKRSKRFASCKNNTHNKDYHNYSSSISSFKLVSKQYYTDQYNSRNNVITSERASRVAPPPLPIESHIRKYRHSNSDNYVERNTPIDISFEKQSYDFFSDNINNLHTLKRRKRSNVRSRRSRKLGVNTLVNNCNNYPNSSTPLNLISNTERNIIGLPLKKLEEKYSLNNRNTRQGKDNQKRVDIFSNFDYDVYRLDKNMRLRAQVDTEPDDYRARRLGTNLSIPGLNIVEELRQRPKCTDIIDPLSPKTDEKSDIKISKKNTKRKRSSSTSNRKRDSNNDTSLNQPHEQLHNVFGWVPSSLPTEDPDKRANESPQDLTLEQLGRCNSNVTLVDTPLDSGKKEGSLFKYEEKHYKDHNNKSIYVRNNTQIGTDFENDTNIADNYIEPELKSFEHESITRLEPLFTVEIPKAQILKNLEVEDTSYNVRINNGPYRQRRRKMLKSST